MALNCYLQGMKVGGQRTIRVPPTLAYGDDWFKGVVPPKSHLEFDVELKTIAQTQQEELMTQIEAFGVGRAAGFVFFTLVLAVLPSLS
jgi:FKBP-type peptidyl-prolyl cis-trans isomerase 2